MNIRKCTEQNREVNRTSKHQDIEVYYITAFIYQLSSAASISSNSASLILYLLTISLLCFLSFIAGLDATIFDFCRLCCGAFLHALESSLIDSHASPLSPNAFFPSSHLVIRVGHVYEEPPSEFFVLIFLYQ